MKFNLKKLFNGILIVYYREILAPHSSERLKMSWSLPLLNRAVFLKTMEMK